MLDFMGNGPSKSTTGLSLDILKMECWTHMGRTANIIIKDVIHVFASISKIMCILLMGRRDCERCMKSKQNQRHRKQKNLGSALWIGYDAVRNLVADGSAGSFQMKTVVPLAAKFNTYRYSAKMIFTSFTKYIQVMKRLYIFPRDQWSMINYQWWDISLMA